MSTKQTSSSLIKTAVLKAVVDKSQQSYYRAVHMLLHCNALTLTERQTYDKVYNNRAE